MIMTIDQYVIINNIVDGLHNLHYGIKPDTEIIQRAINACCTQYDDEYNAISAYIMRRYAHII